MDELETGELRSNAHDVLLDGMNSGDPIFHQPDREMTRLGEGRVDGDTTYGSTVPRGQRGTRKSRNNASNTSKRTFQPAYETFGPMKHAGKVKYRPPSSRQTSRGNLASEKGSVMNLHCDDTLRRVSVVIHRHILVCERRRLIESQQESNEKENISSRRGNGSSIDGATRSRSGSRSSQVSSSSVGGVAAVALTSSNNAGSTPSSPNHNLETSSSARRVSVTDRFKAALLEMENGTELLNENLYLKSQWKYAFIRLPRLPLWTPYRMEPVLRVPEVPSVEQIYSFIRHLFVEAELSSECCVVTLVYVERLMERANVELLATNWRPIMLCGMLLASKVWQDLSSWNIEFARIYPQFSLQSINRLERNFLRLLQWDLFISGTVYAKYYFALRSLNENKNFRRRYNYIISVNAPNSKQLEKRSAAASNSLYSRSM